MAEVTNELIYEVLKNVQGRLDRLDAGIGEVKQELAAMRLSQLSTNTDLSNIYAMLARQDGRLDRIERRLELRELAEPHQPYEPRA